MKDATGTDLTVIIYGQRKVSKSLNLPAANAKAVPTEAPNRKPDEILLNENRSAERKERSKIISLKRLTTSIGETSKSLSATKTLKICQRKSANTIDNAFGNIPFLRDVIEIVFGELSAD